MAHIISSMRAPSSSYIRPDNTEGQTGAELSGWWLGRHNAETARDQHESSMNYYGILVLNWVLCTDAAKTAWGLLTVTSCSSPESCSRSPVIVSQSLSSDPATPHRLSTRYAPCSWNCQESEWLALDLLCFWTAITIIYVTNDIMHGLQLKLCINVRHKKSKSWSPSFRVSVYRI